MGRMMTEEEAWALSGKLAGEMPALGEGTGPLTRRKQLLNALDEASAYYLVTRAKIEHKTPSQIIGELVRGEIARTAVGALDSPSKKVFVTPA